MERKIPTDYELDELAEDFVCSTNDYKGGRFDRRMFKGFS